MWIGAWFEQPKYMPDWLYKFIGETIAPILFQRDGRSLAKPPIYSDTHGAFSPATFWIHPSEPAILLSRHRFDPTLYYRPRIFLWLPHFLVETLHCPKCKTGVLEKNGALCPRRITDINDNFYIVSWAYYCRKGCKGHFAGWSQALIDSLPRYVRLAFPAVLSHRSGLSHQVVTLLRVANQHKMGPNGIRSLLLEMHTLRFSTMQAQYLEAIFEVVCGYESEVGKSSSQNTLHAYLRRQTLPFGDFGSQSQYAGFVPSERYLARMLNMAIEADEQDANQHTAIIRPDQLAIDDSHKVWSYSLHHTLITYEFRSTNTLQRLMVFPFLGHCGHAWILGIFVPKHSH
jgi:hypothetical protein